MGTDTTPSSKRGPTAWPEILPSCANTCSLVTTNYLRVKYIVAAFGWGRLQTNAGVMIFVSERYS